MRRISIICSMAMLVAQMPPGFAQNAVSTPAQPAAFGPAQEVTPAAIVDAFKAFPKGGDLLSKRIEDIIVADPKLAPELAKYAQTAQDLNKDQKQAALRGLAAALNRLGIKAAEYPVPPLREGVVAYENPWLPLVGLAALAAVVCVAACKTSSEIAVISVSPVSAASPVSP